MASKLEVPVFTNTNLGTRVAMAVPPDITAADFKRELERVHLKCFPKSGEIEVCGLMVKRKSCFYHLPDSMPMKLAFQGVRRTWFLHVEARSLTNFNRPSLPQFVATDVGYVSSPGKGKRECKEKEIGEKGLQFHELSLERLQRPLNVSEEKKKNKRETKNCYFGYKTNGNGFECIGANKNTLVPTAKSVCEHPASAENVEPREEWASRSMVEAPSEMSSETKSVTSIINRYFPNFKEDSNFISPTSSEVTSRANKPCREERLTNCSSIQVDSFPQYSRKGSSYLLPSPPSTKTGQGARYNFNRPEVGKRLVMASGNLGISPSKQKTAIYLCRMKDGKVLGLNSSSVVKQPQFEISDSDE
ncbi:uncharacterized protein LOC107415735 isoform X1 [Ziziphus jujuba]|uniref:Uncharacterized protein LOC107415735 isoform X1 n=2 Tax=Ziziphus jujuba TaxID=326968 RepID=A0A6P3ZIP7_ZIZJJ|nr:uncharacterized protein LOC107415735 isoform X1 [Ziziphus jujuba]